jgi:hypothetical protein
MCTQIGPSLCLGSKLCQSNELQLFFLFSWYDWACWEADLGYCLKVFVRTCFCVNSSNMDFNCCLVLIGLHWPVILCLSHKWYCSSASKSFALGFFFISSFAASKSVFDLHLWPGNYTTLFIFLFFTVYFSLILQMVIFIFSLCYV